VFDADGRVDSTASGWTETRKARWKSAMRWRRAVERALAGTGLTFTQWLMLDALRELIAETRDAAIQNEIAARVELDRATISLVMCTLERKGLVDRAPDITGRALRIWLTLRAEALLREQAAGIEAASWVAER
jgi:DNA-binding MarR family transcriptional regulator